MSDPAVDARRKPWSRCVTAGTGVHFATPDAIVRRLKGGYDAHGATRAMHRREIAYAVADARCQFRIGLASAYAKAFRRNADRLSGRMRHLLRHLLDDERSATRRARRVASSHRR